MGSSCMNDPALLGHRRVRFVLCKYGENVGGIHPALIQSAVERAHSTSENGKLEFFRRLGRLPPIRLKTVLLIDDDEVLRSILTELLRSEGWNVLQAEDGEAGLKLALDHKPDVVVCDLLM